MSTGRMSASVGCRALRPSPTRHQTALFIVGCVAATIGFAGTNVFVRAQDLAAAFEPVHDYFRYWAAALALQGSFALVALVFSEPISSVYGACSIARGRV